MFCFYSVLEKAQYANQMMPYRQLWQNQVCEPEGTNVMKMVASSTDSILLIFFYIFNLLFDEDDSILLF